VSGIAAERPLCNGWPHSLYRYLTYDIIISRLIMASRVSATLSLVSGTYPAAATPLHHWLAPWAHYHHTCRALPYWLLNAAGMHTPAFGYYRGGPPCRLPFLLHHRCYRTPPGAAPPPCHLNAPARPSPSPALRACLLSSHHRLPHHTCSYSYTQRLCHPVLYTAITLNYLVAWHSLGDSRPHDGDSRHGP